MGKVVDGQKQASLGIRLNLAALLMTIGGALIAGFSRSATGDMIGLAVVVSAFIVTAVSIVILFKAARAYG